MNSSIKIPDSHEMNVADYIDMMHSNGWEKSFRRFGRPEPAVDEARGAGFRRLESELTDEVNKTSSPSRSTVPFGKTQS
jgi:hypothetical protein